VFPWVLFWAVEEKIDSNKLGWVSVFSYLFLFRVFVITVCGDGPQVGLCGLGWVFDFYSVFLGRSWFALRVRRLGMPAKIGIYLAWSGVGWMAGKGSLKKCSFGGFGSLCIPGGCLFPFIICLYHLFSSFQISL